MEGWQFRQRAGFEWILPDGTGATPLACNGARNLASGVASLLVITQGACITPGSRLPRTLRSQSQLGTMATAKTGNQGASATMVRINPRPNVWRTDKRIGLFLKRIESFFGPKYSFILGLSLAL